MKKIKVKKMIWKVPALLDSTFQINMKQADALIQAAELPSFDAMIADAKRKYPAHRDGLTKHFGSHTQEEAKANMPTPRLRYAFISITVLAILFFTVVPEGRALAARAVEFIVRIFDKGYSFESPRNEDMFTEESYEPNESFIEPEDVPTVEDTTEQMGYATLGVLETETGLHPVSLNMDGAVLSSLTKIDYGGWCSVFSVYILEGGGEIVLIQDFGQIPDAYLSSLNAGAEFTRELFGETLYCIVDQTDGYITGMMALEDTLLTVGLEPGMDVDAVLQCLK